MKKTYITPKMKAMKVQASAIICTSPSIELNSESISDKDNKYSNEDGYGVAW